MKYLMIIFVPPLYLLIRKKPFAFLLNTGLYVTAIFTVFLFGIGFIFWVLSVGHAAWHLRREVMEEHATLIAEKMGEQMSRALAQNNTNLVSQGSQLRSATKPNFRAVDTIDPRPKALAATAAAPSLQSAGIVRSTTQYCPECGARNEAGGTFCESCGAKLD